MREDTSTINGTTNHSPAESAIGNLSKSTRVSPTTVRTCLIIIATIAAIVALQWAKLFFIPLAVAIFAAFWLMPAVDLLQRWRIPRGLGAAVVLFLTLFALVGSGYALRDDARDFLSGLSKAAHQTRVALNQAARDPNGWLHNIRSTMNDRSAPSANARADITGVESVQFSLMEGSTTLAAAAVDTTVVLFLVYLLLASGDLFQRKLLVVISGQLSRKRITVEILHGIGEQFQRYIAVLVTTNAAIGLLTWGLFAAMGVEHAAVWGIAAGVLHIIPYLGPAIIAAASLLVTSAQFNSLSEAVLVASGSLLISALIGMLLTTWLASRASQMNSVAVFVGLLFWGWLWGIPGLLLGTPLMMATKVMADRIESLNWLGTFLGGSPQRVRDKPVATTLTSPESTPIDASVAVRDIAPSVNTASKLPNEIGAIHSPA
jgi:predicted PurR-regulated permease PerM